MTNSGYVNKYRPQINAQKEYIIYFLNIITRNPKNLHLRVFIYVFVITCF